MYIEQIFYNSVSGDIISSFAAAWLREGGLGYWVEDLGMVVQNDSEWGGFEIGPKWSLDVAQYGALLPYWWPQIQAKKSLF